jgi:hypothetical protein
VLRELSATISVHQVKNKAGKVTAHKLTAKVTDAGDAVAGANAVAKGQSKKTSFLGVATLTLPGSSADHITVTITHPGYQALQTKVKL